MESLRNIKVTFKKKFIPQNFDCQRCQRKRSCRGILKRWTNAEMGGVFKHPKTPKGVAFSTYPKLPTLLAFSMLQKLPSEKAESWHSTEKADPRLVAPSWPATSLCMAKAPVQVAIPLVSPMAEATLPHVACGGDAPIMLAFCMKFSCRVRSKQHLHGKSFKTVPNREIVCKRTPFGEICRSMDR